MTMSMPINHTKHKRIVLTVPHDLAAEVADYRFERRLMTESEAWRELIRGGLQKWREEQEAKARRKP